MTASIAMVALFMASAGSAEAALGNPMGARVQVVGGTDGASVEIDVKIVNCEAVCFLTWESAGGSILTLRCLDDGETSTTVFAQGFPRLSHPCIVESTLERGSATESVVLWRAGPCNEPECGPWPQSALP